MKTRQNKNNNFSREPKDNNPKSLWIHGKHSVFLALAKKRRKIFQILATKNSAGELEQFLIKNKLSDFNNLVKIVDNFYIESLIGREQIHQGLAVSCSFLPIKSQNDLFDMIESLALDENDKRNLPTLLILDQLTDPHNIGAIIRSASAFGVKHIIFPEHNFPKESATINKSSSGMIENVDLFAVINLNNLMERLKEVGYWCIGLDGEADIFIHEAKDYKNIALVVGSEGQGIRQLVKKNCDLLVKIPIDKDVESLNASVAAAIALYHFRQ